MTMFFTKILMVATLVGGPCNVSAPEPVQVVEMVEMVENEAAVDPEKEGFIRIVYMHKTHADLVEELRLFLTKRYPHVDVSVRFGDTVSVTAGGFPNAQQVAEDLVDELWSYDDLDPDPDF